MCLGWIWGILFCVSCSTPISQSENVIDIIGVLSHTEELKASDYFGKVRYVTLETTDSCLIGSRPTVRLLADRILVTTNQKQCFLFDKATGRFISSVGHIGEDPQGYRNVNCWVNHTNNTLYFTGWHNDWICYDTNGKYKNTIIIPAKVEEQSRTSTYIDENTYMIETSNLLGNVGDSLLILNNDEVIDKFSLFDSDEQSFDMGSIESLNVLSGSRIGLPHASGMMLLKFKEAGKGTVSFFNLSSFWHVGDDLFYKSIYKDTIYQVKNHRLEPVYSFNMGDLGWSYADRFNIEPGKVLMVTQVLDSRNFMLIRLLNDPLGSEQQVHNAFFTKKTGELKIAPWADQITDDLTHFIPFQPQTVSPSGEYAGVIEAHEVTAWFEENPDQADRLPQEIKRLQTMDEEDNPVVVILE